jgi:hypothetical protein
MRWVEDTSGVSFSGEGTPSGSPTKRKRPPRSSTRSPRSPEDSGEVIDAEFVELSAGAGEQQVPTSPPAPPSAVRVVPQDAPERAADVLACCMTCMTCGAGGAALVAVVGPVAVPICPRCERIGRLAASVLGVR